MKLHTMARTAVAGVASGAAVAALAVLAPAPAQAATVPASVTWCIYSVTVDSLPARAKPSSTAKILYRVQKGDKITAQQSTTNGFHFGNKSGHPDAWFNGNGLAGTGTCFV